MNKAPDREAWLLERARKEGAVTLYTSLAPTESVPLMAEFEKIRHQSHRLAWLE